MPRAIGDLESQYIREDAAGGAGLELGEPVRRLFTLVPLTPGKPVKQHRCLRITFVRLFTSIVILSLGIPKAVSTAEGKSELSNTFDWNSSVVWAVFAYWLSVIENEKAYPKWAEWLFEQDLASLPLIAPIVFFIAYFSVTSMTHIGTNLAEDIELSEPIEIALVFVFIVLGSVLPAVAILLARLVAKQISKHAKRSENRIYTFQVRSLIRRMKAYKRDRPAESLAIILFCCASWVTLFLSFGFFLLPEDPGGSFRDCIWFATIWTIAFTVTSLPFILVFLCVSICKRN